MIFLTVGTQLPFDRLVQIVDDVAPSLGEDIFGQIGRGRYQPTNIEICDFLSPEAFATKLRSARIVIGHAGIGTLLSAKSVMKPVLVMARRADLGEHRNDHQSATAAQLGRTPGVHVFESEDQLRALLLQDDLPAMSGERTEAHNALIAHVREAIVRKTEVP